MLSPDEIDKIKKAIANANSLSHVERLEKALELGELDGVRDLLFDDTIAALWDVSKVKPLAEPIPVKRQADAMLPVRKTPRQQIEEENAKRLFKESARLSEIVCDSIFPKSHSVVTATENGWIESPASSEGKKRILGVECGTALCLKEGVCERNILVRLVVTDFLTDRVLIDADVALPTRYEAVDLFPSITGIETLTDRESELSRGDVLRKLFEFISNDTVLVTMNAFRSAEALRLNHPKWISVENLFQVDPDKKKRGEGQFYVRTNLAPWQLMEAYLGEAAWDRMKVINPRERMVESSLGMLRLIKSLARENPKGFPVMIEPPRKPNTLTVSHIPSNWTEEEIRLILTNSVVVNPIDFFLETVNNEWRGETQVSFRNGEDIHSAFAKLTACTDVFVGWEWPLCGQVSEQTLRALGEDFGPVTTVRVQEKYLAARKVTPGKEESRPFGFISFARYQDALAMTENTRVEKAGVAFHVKISKKPITAFKRVPLGEGQDYIEAFIM